MRRPGFGAEAAKVARAAAADPQRNVRRDEYDIVILFAWARKSVRIDLFMMMAGPAIKGENRPSRA